MPEQAGCRTGWEARFCRNLGINFFDYLTDTLLSFQPSTSMRRCLSEVHRLAEKTAKAGISMHLFSHQGVIAETL